MRASALPLWVDMGMCGNRTLVVTVILSMPEPAMPSTLVINLQTSFSFPQPSCWVLTCSHLTSVPRSPLLAGRSQSFMTDFVRVWDIAFLICPFKIFLSQLSFLLAFSLLTGVSSLSQSLCQLKLENHTAMFSCHPLTLHTKLSVLV